MLLLQRFPYRKEIHLWVAAFSNVKGFRVVPRYAVCSYPHRLASIAAVKAWKRLFMMPVVIVTNVWACLTPQMVEYTVTCRK